MHIQKERRRVIIWLIAGVLAVVPSCSATACTTILIGKSATVDGSVLMGSSCDGDVMGLIYVMPARDYPPNTKLPMYWNVPRPTNYAEYLEDVRSGYDLVGELRVNKTYRTLLFAGNVESMTTGGINEHGLSIAIEFLPMRDGLACDKGVVGPNSNHWTTSLIANGLCRAKTVREAIRLIGSMVEQYGFLYYRAPHAGVALPISDNSETWLMEIFGPGKDWSTESGEPGGVWCAQRIPDGEMGCSANRSRIGAVDTEDETQFLASANIFSLAQSLGLWDPKEPFRWYEVYGGAGGVSNSLREWRALSLAAPSLQLKATGDPAVDRYPFSVIPDKRLAVPDVMSMMRDAYQGTPFDVTKNAAYKIDGKTSPLACPWGPTDVLDLLKVKPNRSICTPTSGYVFIAQLRGGLPTPIGSCVWFAYGPANTSCFVPIYAGVTDLPNTWDHPANFTRIDRSQPQWNFRLVHNLTLRLQYQDALRDIQQVIGRAEKRFFDAQVELERRATRVHQRDGREATEQLLTRFAAQSVQPVGDAYRDLVDYLMLKYLVGDKEFSIPKLPVIAVPNLPAQ